jgi:hypothetical protein
MVTDARNCSFRQPLLALCNWWVSIVQRHRAIPEGSWTLGKDRSRAAPGGEVACNYSAHFRNVDEMICDSRQSQGGIIAEVDMRSS